MPVVYIAAILNRPMRAAILDGKKNYIYSLEDVITTLHKFTPNFKVLDLVYRPGYASDITYVLHLKNICTLKINLKKNSCTLSYQPDISRDQTSLVLD